MARRDPRLLGDATHDDGGQNRLEAALQAMHTEASWLEGLPALLAEYGEAPVKKAAARFLSRSQIKLCFQQLEARSKRLVWVHSAMSNGRIREVRLIVTDHSLNEVERGQWSLPSSEAQEATSVEIIQFLATHCAMNSSKWAGIAVRSTLEVLQHQLPAVFRFIDQRAPLDVGEAGVSCYADLLGLPLVEAMASNGPMSVEAFESLVTANEGPWQNRRLEPLEIAIVALGWARQHLIAPPKAAKYVTAALHAFAVFMVTSAVWNLLIAT